MINAKHLNKSINQSMTKNLMIRSLTFIFIILLFLTPMFSSAELDYANLGINDGDEFTFVVDKFDVAGDQELVDDDSLTCFVPNKETGECDIKAKEGDEFTVKIEDATPFMAENEWKFNSSLIIEGTTVDVVSEEIGSDLTGSLLVPLDFEELKQATQKEFDTMAAEADESAEVTFSGEIVENEKEIGINQSISIDLGSITEEVEIKTRFSKINGFLSYLFIDVKITLPESFGAMIFEFSQISYKLADIDDDPTLPGFGFYVTLIALSIPVIINKRK